MRTRWGVSAPSSGRSVAPIVIRTACVVPRRPASAIHAVNPLGNALPVRQGCRTAGVAAGSRRGRLSAVKTQAIFGMFKSDPAETTRKKYQSRVDEMNKLEPGIAALSDEQLRQKTAQFKARIAGGEPLTSLLPEAFAVGGDGHVTMAAT